MPNPSFPYHCESTVLLHVPLERAFDYLDDPKSLSAHMGKSSMMMMGSRMITQVDSDGGRVVGSKISMSGSVFGIPLALDEVISERQVPYKKIWTTIGNPKLVVISHYQMGFELTPEGESTRLRIFVDYSLPATTIGHWIGLMLAGVYAKWCAKKWPMMPLYISTLVRRHRSMSDS